MQSRLVPPADNEAHDLVYAASRVVNERGGTLAEALAQVPGVTRHFDRAEINRLTDPANYIGSAPTQMVDRVLASVPRDR